jgi:hypothetical protein
MKIELSDFDEKIRFDVKLQISLYTTAVKVMRDDKKDEFEKYMQERVEKIRDMLNIKDEHFKIFENGKLIFEV